MSVKFKAVVGSSSVLEILRGILPSLSQKITDNDADVCFERSDGRNKTFDPPISCYICSGDCLRQQLDALLIFICSRKWLYIYHVYSNTKQSRKRKYMYIVDICTSQIRQVWGSVSNEVYNLTQ